MVNYSDRVKAVIMGHAVADALGVPVEFNSRMELDQNPVSDMMGYGTYCLPEGCWSDDTSMSIATLDSLAEGRVDFEDIMDKLCLWYTKHEYTPMGNRFDVGNICAEAITNYIKGVRPATRCGLDGTYSNGNGSLMRIHPFVLYAFVKGIGFDEWIDIVAQGSCLTHSHERSEIGCGIFSFVLMRLLENPDKSVVYKALSEAEEFYKKHEEIEPYKRLLSPAFDKTDRNEIKSSGYIVDSLEAAIWCLLTTDNYRDCVLKAVNLGEDTDTVAAIAGALAGALYGYDDIPKKWILTLKRWDYLEEMCDRATSVWLKKAANT